MMKRFNSIFFSLVLLATVLALIKDASAIPSFARKYKTSCATCHTVFPRLNAFGEAVRRNGYQFPGGTDPEFIKEEQVSMGSEGYKKAFPDAIWPGAIPGTAPLSFMGELEAIYDAQEKILNLDPLEGEAEVMAGGTLGEDISFMSELEIAEDAIEIERSFFVFTSVVGKPLLFNLKVGKFEANVLSVTNFRRLAPRYWITTKLLGDNKWSLESTQRGLELSGVLASGRLGYNAGLVEGRKNLPNKDKDGYVHLAYKVGGLRLDGVTEGGPALDKQNPWEDNSVTIGTFLYQGTATIATSDTTSKNNGFQMIGGDVNVSFGRINAILGYGLQSDKKPFIGSTEKGKATNLFVEGSYVIYPWLIPVVRFESFKGDILGLTGGVDSETGSRILVVPNILLRPNVKVMIEAEFEKEGDEKMEFMELAFALMFGL